MTPAAMLNHRVRGFRVVDLAAVAVLSTLVLGVYGAKALAGRESAEIGDIDKQIVEEQRRVRLLTAELAHLEQPERIERLSSAYLGLQPISAKRESPADALAEVARQAALQKPLPPAPPAARSAATLTTAVSAPR